MNIYSQNHSCSIFNLFTLKHPHSENNEKNTKLSSEPLRVVFRKYIVRRQKKVGKKTSMVHKRAKRYLEDETVSTA